MSLKELDGVHSPDGTSVGTGGKIEQQALQWGVRRLSETLEGKGKRGAFIRVVTRETDKRISELPRLAEQDKRCTAIRFDRLSGAVYIPSWHEIPVLIDKERRSLTEAKKFIDLRSKWGKGVDLTNLPNIQVKELRLAKCADIQTAIRQAEHIEEAYSTGNEAEQLEVIWREINNAWTLVLTGKVTRENLDELASETASVLRQNGLTAVEKQAKVNIFNKLSRVFETDKLNRLNFLVQRTRLRSAYLSAVGLEAFSVLAGKKYSAMKGVLMMEDAISRQSIIDARDALNTVMGFDRRGAWVFEGGGPQKGEPRGLEIAIHGIVLLTNRSRVAPYLPETRSAGIALWGCQPQFTELNRAVISGEAADVLLDPNFLSVRALLGRGDYLEAKKLAKKWVFDPLIAFV